MCVLRHTFLFFGKVVNLMKESTFQANLVRKLRSFDWVKKVIKNDANQIQGFPDLTVYLKNGKWALLECKQHKAAKRQPNQQYYIQDMAEYGFARFIYPENEEEILRELGEYASRAGRKTRSARSKQACLDKL